MRLGPTQNGMRSGYSPAWWEYADVRPPAERWNPRSSVACTERGNPVGLLAVNRQLGNLQRLPTAQRAQDRGRSECPAVMAGIGDGTIAPTRKGADVRVVAYR